MRPSRFLAAAFAFSLAFLFLPADFEAQCYSCVGGGTYGWSTYCESGATNGSSSCVEVSSGGITECGLGGSACNFKPAFRLAAGVPMIGVDGLMTNQMSGENGGGLVFSGSSTSEESVASCGASAASDVRLTVPVTRSRGEAAVPGFRHDR